MTTRQIINSSTRNLSLNSFRISNEEAETAARLWQFPSDHLPVYARINRHLVGSWNILAHKALPHIEKNPTWQNSSLVTLSRNFSLLYPDLSEREVLTVNHISRLMEGEKPPVRIFCLQECSARIAKVLKLRLEPQGIGVIVGEGHRDINVITLFNQKFYTPQEIAIRAIFSRTIPSREGLVLDVWRPAVDIRLMENLPTIGMPEQVRVVNLHISSAGQGEEYKIDRLKEVLSFLEKHPSTHAPTLVCGDYNADKALVHKVFSHADSLCGHYTQIETIVPTNKEEEESREDLHSSAISIDDVMFDAPAKTAKTLFEREGIPFAKIDPLAREAYREIFEPLIVKPAHVF